MMDANNFRPSGMTPLYDQAMVVIGGAMLMAKQFDDKGIMARTWTLILTDGADCASNAKAADVANLIRGLNSELHIVMGMGVSDGKTDFHAIFKAMGIGDDKILIADGGDPKSIRRQFELASQSAVALNQPNKPPDLGGFGL